MKVRIENPTGHPHDTNVYDAAGEKFKCVDAFTVSQSSRDTDGPRAELSLFLIPYDIKASLAEVSLTIPIPVGVTAGAEMELELRALITSYFAEKLKGDK